MMDDNSVKTLIADKNDMTVERLIEIQEQSQQVRPDEEAKVLRILQEGSFTRKDLRKRCKMKSAHFSEVLSSLESQGKVKIVMVPNAKGRDTTLISAVKVADNSESARQRRINALAAHGLYLTPGNAWR